MKKENFYRIFLNFIKENLHTVLRFLAYLVIFAVMFVLYGLEAEAWLYATALCLLISAAAAIRNFISYFNRHKTLQRIEKNIQYMIDDLPEQGGLIEADYKEALRSYKRVFEERIEKEISERRDMVDYYTTWAHQIKTPIAVMKMTLNGEDTAEHRELDAELFRIERYVDMALGYLRLGEGSSDFVFREYSLDAIIKRAVHKYAPQFVRARLSLNYEPTDLVVLTDEKWLLFIIEQLLSNAIKYTREGSVSISASEDKILKISDTGIGIAPEDIPRIFEKGFTGYNGRIDNKSTGLGLYLCRRTAEKLSCKISVESSVGKGSVFSIDLNTYNLEVE